MYKSLLLMDSAAFAVRILLPGPHRSAKHVTVVFFTT